MSRLIKLRTKGDDRGSLTVLEKGKEIPFSIKRIYYLSDTVDGVSRGFHAHKKLEQIAICVAGSCEFLIDDGLERKTFVLDSSDVGLYIENFVWREMHNFSSDCVLLVLASEKYDESDYIRSYEDFTARIIKGE
jgi:dTDP-4-dehydrorhamnose 3,5-epimerase-like enzyme